MRACIGFEIIEKLLVFVIVNIHFLLHQWITQKTTQREHVAGDACELCTLTVNDLDLDLFRSKKKASVGTGALM